MVRISGTVVDVTDQVMSQSEEVATKSFQQAVFSASPDVISVWDFPSRSILWTNRSIPEMLGYSEQDVKAMGGEIGIVVPAEDRVRLSAALARAGDAANDDVVEVDYRMRHRDGTTRWFSQRTAPLTRDRDGRVTQIVGVLRDTTDSLAAESALRAKDAFLDQVTESLDVAFLLRSWDPPEFLYVSPAYSRIFGYDPMAIHQSPDERVRVVHPDDRERYLTEYWAPSLAGKAATADFRIFRADGELRWLRAKTTPVGNPEENWGRSASTIEDITASRNAEAAVRAAVEAQKANAAKNEFLSRMSHELRTPLNAVLGFAQLLEMDAGPEQQDAVKQILRGGYHLLGLIDDVLDISKIENDRLDMSLELVPISELLTETVELMTPQADAAGVRLRFVTSTSAGRPVHADQRRLRQVLLNLLSNAIKYNRHGGSVEVSCEAAGPTTLAINVQDSGRGIRTEDLPRLFTPFDRLDAAGTGIDGSGVGLALSRRLMTLMGGTLTATSQAGIGSIFTAGIPFATEQWAEPAAAVAGLLPKTQLGPEPTAIPTRTLLYVEDNSPNIHLMEQLVTRRPPWQLLVAGHGELGLELAASTQPELILLDLHLPDMHGIDILHRLRSEPATMDLKVVVLSADANPHQISRLLAAGASAYLTKPLDVGKVLEFLDAPR